MGVNPLLLRTVCIPIGFEAVSIVKSCFNLISVIKFPSPSEILIRYERSTL